VINGGGTINGNGVYTAPGTTGSAVIRAVSGTFSDDSFVTITNDVLPQAWWKLDASTGTVVSDASGNGHDGAAAGPTWVTGRNGNGLNFDGNDWVDVPTGLVNSSAGSVSMWVKTATNFSNFGHLFYASPVGTGDGIGPEQELYLDYTANEQLNFFIKGTTNVNLTTAATYADNIWHHVAATWDINGNAVLYVDGVQASSSAHHADAFVASAITRLGRPGAATRYFTGQIDDVRLFSTALSASQVQAIKNEAIMPTTFNGGPEGDSYYLKRNGSNLDIWINGHGTGAPTYSLAYASLSALTFNGNGGNDALTIDASVGNPIPASGISFDGGVGIDSVAIVGSVGADDFVFNPGAVVMGATLAHNSVERRTLDGNGGRDSLAVNGGIVTLASSLNASALSIAGNATLDVASFSFSLDYDNAPSPIAMLTSLIARGRNGGAWTGSGIVTSSASGGLATLGLAEASDVFHLSGYQTALWNGQTLDATSVMVKFTYSGDADLNGRLDGDDYFVIDSHAGVTPPAGSSWSWFQGDFDYTTRINGDDYFLLDSNLGRQGVVL
jgi:hypothetical protein